MTMKQFPDRILERFVLNELPENDMNNIRAALESDAALKKRVDDLLFSNEEFLKNNPFERVESFFKRHVPVEKSRKKFITKKRLIPAIAFSIPLSVFLLFSFSTGLFNTMDDTTVIKGRESSLFIYKQTGTQVVQLNNGDKARKGDLLQLAYQITSGSYLFIFSIDGRGNITYHYPSNPSAPARIISHKKILLAESYELDDAPAFERFFMISSPQSFDMPALRNTIEKFAASKNLAQYSQFPIEGPFTINSLLIIKEK